jgi:hypothetical protein
MTSTFFMQRLTLFGKKPAKVAPSYMFHFFAAGLKKFLVLAPANRHLGDRPFKEANLNTFSPLF